MESKGREKQEPQLFPLPFGTVTNTENTERDSWLLIQGCVVLCSVGIEWEDNQRIASNLFNCKLHIFNTEVVLSA